MDFNLFILIQCFTDPSSVTVIATCTMEKVMRQSGPLSNEGVQVDMVDDHTAPSKCDDGTNAIQRCNQLSSKFVRNFRTLEGECNNIDSPLNGSKGSRLSRLLDAEHTKFQVPTYFKNPRNQGELSFYSNFFK